MDKKMQASRIGIQFGPDFDGRGEHYAHGNFKYT